MNTFIDIDIEYVIGKKLKCGSFSKVFEVTNKLDNNKYALKLHPFDEKLIIDPIILREIDILKKINHKNVVKPLKIFFGNFENKKFFCILMKWYELTLYEYIIKKKGNELNKKKKNLIFNQILDALFYMDQSGYNHNDLTYLNIMMNEQNPVLIDFGFSKKIYRSNNFLPTMAIRPIELFNINHYKENDKIDIWALGCIYYFIFKKKFIALEETENDQILKIFNKFGFPNNEDVISLNIKNIKCKNKIINFFKKIMPRDKFLKKMLEYNPKKRASLSELMHSRKIPKENYVYNNLIKLDNYNNNLSFDQNYLFFFSNFFTDVAKENNSEDELVLTTLYIFKKFYSLNNNIVSIINIYALLSFFLVNNIVSDKYFEVDTILLFLKNININLELHEVVDYINEILVQLDWNIDPNLSYSLILEIPKFKRNLFKLIIFVCYLYNIFDKYPEKYKTYLTFLILDELENKRKFIEKVYYDETILINIVFDFKNVILELKNGLDNKGIISLNKFCELIDDDPTTLLSNFFQIVKK
ncbi:Protein kinase [uncultured virus]|nr:Protein kinase [uncultured virus]